MRLETSVGTNGAILTKAKGKIDAITAQTKTLVLFFPFF